MNLAIRFILAKEVQQLALCLECREEYEALLKILRTGQ